jgi:hypothetical protein
MSRDFTHITEEWPAILKKGYKFEAFWIGVLIKVRILTRLKMSVKLSISIVPQIVLEIILEIVLKLFPEIDHENDPKIGHAIVYKNCPPKHP